jgi:tetratricopeptide (TPR) repeat protein
MPAVAQDSTLTVENFCSQYRYSEALNAARLLVQQEPNNAFAHILVGDVYAELEKPDAALTHYCKAREIDTANTVAKRKAIDMLSRLGYHLAALEQAKVFIKQNPRDADGYLVLGAIYIRGDESSDFAKAKVENPLTKADAAVIKAQSIDKSAVSYVARGDLYYAQSVFELAKTNYEEALSLNPRLTKIQYKILEIDNMLPRELNASDNHVRLWQSICGEKVRIKP